MSERQGHRRKGALRRSVTPTDVGAAAGVSRTTVSWVLNGRARRIPAATQERVREAARRSA